MRALGRLTMAGWLVVAGAWVLPGGAGAQANNYTHIYYYGWYPENWTSPNQCWSLFPTLANQCVGPEGQSCSRHRHIGGSSQDIAAVFFPSLGQYSTSNSTVLLRHRDNVDNAGAKSVILSYAPGSPPTLGLITQISQTFATRSIKSSVAFRDYSGRTASSVQQEMRNLMLSGSPRIAVSHQYRVKLFTQPDPDSGSEFRPVFYFYAPRLTPTDWQSIFPSHRAFRQNNDFIALAGTPSLPYIVNNGFDGYYRYAPAQPVSGTVYRNETRRAWNNDLIYSAGVAPGYNAKRTKNDVCRARVFGVFAQELRTARAPSSQWSPHFVSVISFNEWQEGTQIEPAVTLSNGLSGVFVSSSLPDGGYQYLAYGLGPKKYHNFYLDVMDNNVGPGRWLPKRNGTVVAFPVQ